jgi:hypothetical protein
MLSDVKYVYVPVGGSTVYETCEYSDRVAAHQSFAELVAAVSRPGKRIIAIAQRGMDITDESYNSIRSHLRLAVVCGDVVG